MYKLITNYQLLLITYIVPQLLLSMITHSLIHIQMCLIYV